MQLHHINITMADYTKLSVCGNEVLQTNKAIAVLQFIRF